MKIKIFISYSDNDKRKVDIIGKRLKKDPDFQPIIIANKKDPLKPLTAKVISGMNESKYFLPILTTNSINVQWINQEIGFASSLQENGLIEIVPIVEKQIMSKLRGFIHKGVDLPFVYSRNNGNIRIESMSYGLCLDNLIEHLRKGNIPLRYGHFMPSSIFSGEWNNEYVFNGISNSETFTIENRYKYYTNGRHVFNILNFIFDPKESRLSFRKVGINDLRDLKNTLRKVDDNTYEGTEYNHINRMTLNVKYTKIK